MLDAWILVVTTDRNEGSDNAGIKAAIVAQKTSGVNCVPRVEIVKENETFSERMNVGLKSLCKEPERVIAVVGHGVTDVENNWLDTALSHIRDGVDVAFLQNYDEEMFAFVANRSVFSKIGYMDEDFSGPTCVYDFFERAWRYLRTKRIELSCNIVPVDGSEHWMVEDYTRIKNKWG